jgi:hypothetical protein
MTATAAGLTALPGSLPLDQATTRGCGRRHVWAMARPFVASPAEYLLAFEHRSLGVRRKPELDGGASVVSDDLWATLAG